MEKGRIKEIGTHAELLENSGYIRRLYDLQFNRNPDEPGAEVELLAEAATAWKLGTPRRTSLHRGMGSVPSPFRARR